MTLLFNKATRRTSCVIFYGWQRKNRMDVNIKKISFVVRPLSKNNQVTRYWRSHKSSSTKHIYFVIIIMHNWSWLRNYFEEVSKVETSCPSFAASSMHTQHMHLHWLYGHFYLFFYM